jgi:hypothetical protein
LAGKFGQSVGPSLATSPIVTRGAATRVIDQIGL